MPLPSDLNGNRSLTSWVLGGVRSRHATSTRLGSCALSRVAIRDFGPAFALPVTDQLDTKSTKIQDLIGFLLVGRNDIVSYLGAELSARFEKHQVYCSRRAPNRRNDLILRVGTLAKPVNSTSTRSSRGPLARNDIGSWIRKTRPSQKSTY